MTTINQVPDEASLGRTKLTVRGLYDTQKLRIQLELRIKRLVRDGLMEKEEAKTFFELPFGKFEQAEKDMERIVWQEVKDIRIVKEWLSLVKGIGPRLSGLLYANIVPISRFATRSGLYSYAGMGTELRIFFIDSKAKEEKSFRLAEYYEEDGIIHYKTLKYVFEEVKEEEADAEEEDKDEDEVEIEEEESFVKRKLVKVISDWQKIESSKVEIRRVAQRRRKGEVSNWNSELKTTCWKIGKSFAIQSESPYRSAYEKYKRRTTEREVAKGNVVWGYKMAKRKGKAVKQMTAIHFDENVHGKDPDKPKGRPEWTLGRIDAMSLRWVAKLFLSHLWEVWRKMEKLSTRDPYAHEYLEHTQRYDPWDFIEEKEEKENKKTKAKTKALSRI